MRENSPEPLHESSDIELAIAVAEAHDALEDILDRLDSGRLVSRHAGADVLEALRSISDCLFNREQ